MDESHQHDEFSQTHEGVYTVWVYLYNIQKQVKLFCGHAGYLLSEGSHIIGKGHEDASGPPIIFYFLVWVLYKGMCLLF